MWRGRELSTLISAIVLLALIAVSLDLPPTLVMGLLALVITVAIRAVYSRRQTEPSQRSSADTTRGTSDGVNQPSSSRPTPISSLPRRWILLPAVLVLIGAAVISENWWLGVKILESIYVRKASISWWNLAYLNNQYFYSVLVIGLIVALSDPRLIVERAVGGKRRFYIHSKSWAVINALRSLPYRLRFFQNARTVRVQEGEDDRIPLELGLAWRALQFSFACLAAAAVFAKDWSFQYLLISSWVEREGITWVDLAWRTVGVLYSRLVLAETPTGSTLIANSPILEFLLWLRIPAILLAAVWSVRLVASTVLELLRGSTRRAVRNVALVGVMILFPFLILTPTQVFDVSTPYYLRTLLTGGAMLLLLALFLSLRERFVTSAVELFLHRRIAAAIVIVLGASVLLYGPITVAVQIAPAMEGHWQQYLWTPKYLPNVEYTRWATGIDPIVEDNIGTAMNTGDNIGILARIRTFNRESAVLRMRPSIGVNWMDIGDPDIVNIRGNEYWVNALKIVQPTGADPWRSSRLLITHSERILAIDASDGSVITDASRILNVTGTPQIYYGEGGLFAESDIVYISIPGFAETHLQGYVGASSYTGEPDYVLSGFERLWFFSGIFGKEQLRLDFGRGDYGDVKMLYLRDVSKRLKEIILPGMTLDEDPYLVSDGTRLYYSFYVYIERDMPTEYLDYPAKRFRFYRIFATVLVDAYDGRMTGYLLDLGESNYVLDFYRDMYPQWDVTLPDWILRQLRYPEYLFNKQIQAYNTYHVSDADKWQKNTDFFQLTTDARGSVFEEVRFVTFSLNQREVWAGVRQVEGFQAPGKNLAGVYAALNGKDLGQIYFLRTGTVALIGPQTAIDTVNNYGPTKFQLTTHTNPAWVSGNILMYVVNGSAYYFIPYYAQTPLTLSPAMMVTVDALTQRVGHYVISNPQDAAEVASSAERAYLDLVGASIGSTAEMRRKNTYDVFGDLGFELRTPQRLNPDVAFQVDSVDYLSEDELPNVKRATESFVDRFVRPHGFDTVLLWEEIEAGHRNLNFGVLTNQEGVVHLNYFTVTYSAS